jgi:hypothetical protein
MLDFDRFDFNTKGDKVTIKDTRSGDTATLNRTEYAKNVKTGYVASVLVAGLYGLAAGFLLAPRQEAKRIDRKNKRRRRISQGISRLAFWK